MNKYYFDFDFVDDFRLSPSISIISMDEDDGNENVQRQLNSLWWTGPPQGFKYSGAGDPTEDWLTDIIEASDDPTDFINMHTILSRFNAWALSSDLPTLGSKNAGSKIRSVFPNINYNKRHNRYYGIRWVVY